ncbi:hypothetical protein C8R43DRAFT_637197 [Mycena crocata]|nr:hypothetical protein C8R43DRAFT_637197 [Mycena crocata]
MFLLAHAIYISSPWPPQQTCSITNHPRLLHLDVCIRCGESYLLSIQLLFIVLAHVRGFLQLQHWNSTLLRQGTEEHPLFRSPKFDGPMTDSQKCYKARRRTENPDALAKSKNDCCWAKVSSEQSAFSTGFVDFSLSCGIPATEEHPFRRTHLMDQRSILTGFLSTKELLCREKNRRQVVHTLQIHPTLDSP